MTSMGALVRILPDRVPATVYLSDGSVVWVWMPDGKIQARPIESVIAESGDPLKGEPHGRQIAS